MLLYPSKDAVTVKDVIEQKLSTLGESNENNEKSNDKNKEKALDLNIIEYVVFIDSTWQQSKKISKDERVQKLPKVKICNQKTLFWRYQQFGEEFLATIEAIYFFFREYCIYSDIMKKKEIKLNKTKVEDVAYDEEGNPKELAKKYYHGECDDLLFFYVFQYNLIQKHYRDNPSLSFTKKSNYIEYTNGKQKNNNNTVEQENNKEQSNTEDMEIQPKNKKLKET